MDKKQKAEERAERHAKFITFWGIFGLSLYGFIALSLDLMKWAEHR